jgi:hypothetical protein
VVRLKTLSFKVLSVFAALALLVPVFMVPAAAVQAQEKYQREEVVYLDAEVRVINGQPVIMVETEAGYESIPFELPSYLHGADGQKAALEMQGNSVVLPTEDGPVAVPIEDFCVVVVDGQVALMAEVNLKWLIPAAKLAIIAYVVAKAGGCVNREINHWLDGLCAAPWCSEPDPGLGLFCGHPDCAATELGLGHH